MTTAVLTHTDACRRTLQVFGLFAYLDEVTLPQVTVLTGLEPNEVVTTLSGLIAKRLIERRNLCQLWPDGTGAVVSYDGPMRFAYRAAEGKGPNALSEELNFLLQQVV